MSAIKKLVGFSFLIAAAATGYVSYRNHAMDRLYAETAGIPPFFRSTAESKAALEKLAPYRGRRSTALLLEIASQEGPLGPDTQTEAIKVLSRRKDPQIAVTVGSLLQPQEGLDTRKTAAAALQNLPCNPQCITSIMHYLERIWQGEPNFEDRWVLQAGGDERAIASHKAGQQAIYNDLFSVLRREKKETFIALANVYGLRSVVPSPFALDLVSRLELHEACPYLAESQRQLKDLSPEFFKAPRQELLKTIASLKCE